MIGTNEKKEKIKKLAFQLFLETGYEATTVRMLCKEAKIESPTLYHYFKSKKGLFLSIRNDITQEYTNLVVGLCLDECVGPEEALKKYYKFCMNYVLENTENTRFYLRYRLFKPAELQSEIDEYIADLNKEKYKQYLKYIQMFIDSGKLEYSREEAFQKYINFIDNCTFNIIFSQWKPSEDEIGREWNKFFVSFMGNNS